MPTKRKARPRKPREVLLRGTPFAVLYGDEGFIDACWFKAKDARRLAAWLLKAADWLEWKEKNG